MCGGNHYRFVFYFSCFFPRDQGFLLLHFSCFSVLFKEYSLLFIGLTADMIKFIDDYAAQPTWTKTLVNTR